MKLTGTIVDGKLQLDDHSKQLLEAKKDVEIEAKKESEGYLRCGCQFAAKFNSGDPRWFMIEHCEHHKDVSIGVSPRNFDPDLVTALLDAAADKQAEIEMARSDAIDECIHRIENMEHDVSLNDIVNDLIEFRKQKP